MPAGVTPQGLEIKTVEQINAEISNAQLSVLGADLDTSPEQPLGQLNGIVATKAAELWELGQVAYNAFNPASAEGTLLDVIGSLRGVPRLAATYGTVVLSVSLNSGTTLISGTHMANVAGQSNNRWTPVANFTAPSTGSHNVSFRSAQTGAFPANAGTITEITTALAGWNSVTNVAQAVTGKPVESDTDYRTRQASQLSATGSSTVDALRADLLALAGVQQVTIFENTSDFYDTLGLPPHSFEAIIRDGGFVANATIAQILWDNKPAGIPTFGSTSAQAVDALGNSQTVFFTRPTNKTLSFYPTVTTLPGFNQTTQQPIIIQQIQNYLASLKVGEDVVFNRIRAIILAQPFVWDVPTVAIDGADGYVVNGTAYTVGVRQVAAYSTYLGTYNPIPVAP